MDVRPAEEELRRASPALRVVFSCTISFSESSRLGPGGRSASDGPEVGEMAVAAWDAEVGEMGGSAGVFWKELLFFRMPGFC